MLLSEVPWELPSKKHKLRSSSCWEPPLITCPQVAVFSSISGGEGLCEDSSALGTEKPLENGTGSSLVAQPVKDLALSLLWLGLLR